MKLFHKKKSLGKFLCGALILTLLASGGAVHPDITAEAAYVDTNLNTFIHDASDTPVAGIGQDFQLTVKVGFNGVNGLYNPTGDVINNVRVRLSQDQTLVNTRGIVPNANKSNPYDDSSDDEQESLQHDAYNEGYQAGAARAYNASLGQTYPVDGGTYPLEIGTSSMNQEKSLGSLKKGEYREVTFHVKIRNDIKEGYYAIPISMNYDVPYNSTGQYGSLSRAEYINIYVQDLGTVSNPTGVTKDQAFSIGEGQAAPSGTYPGTMDFAVNFRNQKGRALYDVVVRMNKGATQTTGDSGNTTQAGRIDVSSFPFRVTEENYDRSFETVEADQTISAPYSMAIAKDSKTGDHAIGFTVSYKDTPGATVTKTEQYTYYVHISNPSTDETTSQREFNANDRSKARIVVAGYHTEPEKVLAGQPFKLVVEMQNASTGISASNIMLSLESEKVSDSAALSTENGANSYVINSLAAGETKELSWNMVAAAGLDPRSYALTINEKYDSPDFKNAEEKVSLNINVNQEARLSVSNYDVMPESIEVGNEANVTFNINNTGKVILYNVTANFKGDSIQDTSSYVGNIKPGESGSVDAMLTGAAPTMDDGTISVSISYENVNGEVFTSDQSINLMVTEPVNDFDGMDGADAMPTEEPGFFQKYKLPLLAGAVIFVALLALIIRRLHKKKQEKERDETI
ncbi:MAG TPA: hypothetical protein DIW34_01515 [Oribacterium sp.]|nr:hypothetical protein [Oribacterium sp.]